MKKFDTLQIRGDGWRRLFFWRKKAHFAWAGRDGYACVRCRLRALRLSFVRSFGRRPACVLAPARFALPPVSYRRRAPASRAVAVRASPPSSLSPSLVSPCVLAPRRACPHYPPPPPAKEPWGTGNRQPPRPPPPAGAANAANSANAAPAVRPDGAANAAPAVRPADAAVCASC